MPSDLARSSAIFVAHPSALLTDHLANGDGQVAYGFLSGLAARGYELHVAVDRVSLQRPLPPNLFLYPVRPRMKNRGLRLLEFAVRSRLLFNRLRRQHGFQLVLQMNPVFPGLSLAFVGCGLPVILGTYVPRWAIGSMQFVDGYGGSTGLAAKLRDVVVALQQRCADALLLTTPAAKNRMAATAGQEGKIFYLPHGIDEQMFRSPAAANTSADQKPGAQRARILFIGSVSERKGIFDLLHAFEKVLALLPNARLTILGPGDDLERVRSVLTLAPFAEHVELRGPVLREQTAEVYRQHDLYCLPSYGEPYATTLLEAMASGLPVVSTNTGGTPFLVPADGGLLVKPGSVDDLAHAILTILTSPDLARSMGQSNREAVTSRFAWSKVLDRLEGIYFEVTRGRVGNQQNADFLRQPSETKTLQLSE